MPLGKFKILHAPIDVAGQAGVVSRAQRQLGFESDLLVFDPSRFDYKFDRCLYLSQQKTKWRIFLRVLVNFFQCLFKYDVFHFHYGQSLLPFNTDLPILKFLGKKVIMTYWGSDIMQMNIARKYTLFGPEVFQNVYGGFNDTKQVKKIAWIEQNTDQTIVADYSLLPFSKKSQVIRQAIEIEQIPFVGVRTDKKKVTIVHAPSNRDVKGTKYILSEIERLQKEGHNIDFIMVENKSHHDAMKIYKKADLVIDDVLQGPYGILSIECMALGKPVLCRIDRHFVKCYKNLPIVNTPPEKIYANLKKLILNPALRVRLAEQGRQYVKKNHDSRVIAQKYIKLYEKI